MQGMLNAILIFLFSTLINGRNLRTTIQKGFKYHLGAQYLIAWSGTNLRLRRVYLDEHEVYSGDVGRTADGSPVVVSVNDESLFGGVDENGGFVGDLRFYLGGDNQSPDPWVCGQMTDSHIPANLRGLSPAYRPFVTMTMPTAYIGKRATLPALWVELANIPDHLGLGGIGDDANPAEAIYELVTNADWGIGESPDVLDLDALREMGRTLAEEGLGVSLRLDTTQKALDVLDAVCEHVNAVRAANPNTGKVEFRLIRGDYDPNDCLTLDESNLIDISLTRLDWSQTVSKVTGRFTAAESKYEEGSVSASDGAAFAISRARTAKSYDFAFFTTAANARWAVLRELFSQAYPLAAVSLTGNRALYGVRVGDVVRLAFPPYGVKQMFLRVTDVDVAAYLDGQIKLEAVEDVFGLPKQQMLYTGDLHWETPESFPRGVQMFRYLELPYELTHDERESHVAAMAQLPATGVADYWTVWRHPEGGAFAPSSSLSRFTPSGKLVYGLDEFAPVEDGIGFEIHEHTDIDTLRPPATPAPGCTEARKGNQMLVIGDEIIAYSGLRHLANGNWQVFGLLRGACDTVPQKHNAQEPVYFLSSGQYQLVTGSGGVCPLTATTTEKYNIVTTAGRNTEDFDDAKVAELTTAQRAARPCVMGRVRVSDLFARDAYHNDSVALDVAFTWAARNNRQTGGAVSQDDVDNLVPGSGTFPIAAPDGAKYRVSIVDAAGHPLWSEDVATLGDTVPWETVCQTIGDLRGAVSFKLETVNADGLASYQAQRRTMFYRVPVLADFVAGEADARSKTAAWLAGSRLVVPPGGVLFHDLDLLITDVPLFLVGAPDASGLLGRDGATYLPTGEAYIVNADGTLTRRDLRDGFAFRTYFVHANSSHVYSFSNGAITPRTEVF